MSRRRAVQAAHEDGAEVDPEPGAEEGPGLRRRLSAQSGGGRPAASFDTRLDRSPALVGSAARGIARRLRYHGFEVVDFHESFFVDDAEGPLAEGELDRAREWGMDLADRFTFDGDDGPG